MRKRERETGEINLYTGKGGSDHLAQMGPAFCLCLEVIGVCTAACVGNNKLFFQFGFRELIIFLTLRISQPLLAFLIMLSLLFL